LRQEALNVIQRSTSPSIRSSTRMLRSRIASALSQPTYPSCASGPRSLRVGALQNGAARKDGGRGYRQAFRFDTDRIRATPPALIWADHGWRQRHHTLKRRHASLKSMPTPHSAGFRIRTSFGALRNFASSWKPRVFRSRRLLKLNQFRNCSIHHGLADVATPAACRHHPN
jgi:hypothetical protein